MRCVSKVIEYRFAGNLLTSRHFLLSGLLPLCMEEGAAGVGRESRDMGYVSAEGAYLRHVSKTHWQRLVSWLADTVKEKKTARVRSVRTDASIDTSNMNKHSLTPTTIPACSHHKTRKDSASQRREQRHKRQGAQVSVSPAR